MLGYVISQPEALTADMQEQLLEIAAKVGAKAVADEVGQMDSLLDNA